MRNAYKFIDRKPEWRRPVGRPMGGVTKAIRGWIGYNWLR
jgi:hypothetical protein